MTLLQQCITHLVLLVVKPPLWQARPTSWEPFAQGSMYKWDEISCHANPMYSHLSLYRCLHSLYQPALFSQFCGMGLEFWSSFPLSSLGCVRELFRHYTIKWPSQDLVAGFPLQMAQRSAITVAMQFCPPPLGIFPELQFNKHSYIYVTGLLLGCRYDAFLSYFGFGSLSTVLLNPA